MDHPEGPTLSKILIQRIVSITQNFFNTQKMPLFPREGAERKSGNLKTGKRCCGKSCPKRNAGEPPAKRQKLPRANAWLALDEYGEEDFLTVDIENEQKNFPAYPANAIMLPFK